MQKSKKLALLATVAFLSLLIPSLAYAQTTTNPPLTDNEFNIIVIACVVGALSAPIIGWATSETTPATPPATTSTSQKFNWKQYALSIVIGVPATLALIMTEISTLHVTIVGYQGDAMLFIMALIQALGVDYSKSRIQTAISNP